MMEPATGALLVVGGLGLRAWAMVHLARAGVRGEAFNAIATPPHGYTHHGPYRFVRHPAYIGSMAFLAGLGVLAFGFPGVVLFVPAWPFFYDRIVREEKLRRHWLNARAVERMRRVAGGSQG